MISIVSVYNSERILEDNLVKSLKSQTSEHELILMDNTQGKYKSAAEALNCGGSRVKGKYIMFVHQDVDLCSNTLLENTEIILNSIPNLGIAGVAGARSGKTSKNVESITNIQHGIPATNILGTIPLQKPEKVQTLDECLVIIPRSVFNMLQFDEKVCDDWHLYAVDYSLSVARLGLDVYVIPASIYHRSTGVPIKSFWQAILSGGFLDAGYYPTLGKLLKKHRSYTKKIYTTAALWSTTYPLTLRIVGDLVLYAYWQSLGRLYKSPIERINDGLNRIMLEARSPSVSLPRETNNITFEVVLKNVDARFIELEGWAFIEGQSSENSQIYVVLKSDFNTHIFHTMRKKRPDVTNLFKTLNMTHDDSGFSAVIPKDKVKESEYIVGIYIIKGNMEALHYGDMALKNGVELTPRISRLQFSLPTESGNIRMNIDSIQEVIKDKRGFIEIAGWAHIEGKNSENSRIHVVLKSDSNTYIFNTALRKRPDITNFFKTLQSHLDLDDAGFFTRIPQEKIKKDKYTVGIYIIRGDVEALQYGEIIVEKGIELTLRISKLRNESETCNWEYIVQTVNDRCILKVRPLNTVYANELSKPLMYPIERNDIDFEIIDSFLFDLTNSCNLRCPFCYSSPQNKPVKLTDFDYQVISEILRNLRSEGKLQYIQVGCDFEPLLSDKFESYAEAFKQLFKGPGAPLIGIITNGILLDPNKLKYYSSAAGSNLFVHISFHSHKKEVFGSYIKRLDFNKLVNNIITIRELCPDVRIELCNVLTKLNFIDIPGYLDYVFNQLKVNIVHFRRPDLSPLSDDRRAQLELEPGKFAELHDWLSISDSYMVLKTVDMNSSVFSVYRIEQPEAGFLLEKTRGF